MGCSHCGVSHESNLRGKHSNDPERHRINNHDFIVVDENPVPTELRVTAHYVFRNGGQPHTSGNHGVHTEIHVEIGYSRNVPPREHHIVDARPLLGAEIDASVNVGS